MIKNKKFLMVLLCYLRMVENLSVLAYYASISYCSALTEIPLHKTENPFYL